MRALKTDDSSSIPGISSATMPFEASHAIEFFNNTGFSPPETSEALPIPIRETDDIVIARQAGRRLGENLGCSDSKIALITTVVSELGRNIILYAKKGEISVSEIRVDSSNAILIIANDNGPGIADVECAIAGGYSTSGGLGLGLSGLSQIADRFEIDSHSGQGTCVKVIILTG